ncbi:TetR/AcrR family transcriptional regulator [Halocella sp. SP3-1]|nr:TetR/AcrR family transcriptional regulator [Halocella sp. SP3-1]
MVTLLRISKDPAERKNEIIDAAERLFMEDGFDNTTVGDIVNEVGIAKGTFYYHFATKESIIVAIVERRLNKGKKKAETVLNDKELNAVEKMERVMKILFLKAPEDKKIFHYFDLDSNAKIHQKRDELFHKIFKDIILQIVEEGVQDELFKCEYYQEITEIIFIGIDRFMHINLKNFRNKGVFNEKVKAIEELLERVLGLEKGVLKILESI